MKISELESTEHLMKESSINQAELERQYRQQLQELEKKCAEQKDHIASLEAICAMQQGESIQESQKELEQNKAVIAQLQAQSAKLQTELQECDMRYKQVASNLEDAHQKQTDLLQESRAAMTRSLQLTEENAKLHEQNFNLMEDVKSLKLQQQGSTGSEVSSLRDQLNQVIMERDNIQKQMANTEHYKTLLEGENISQKATIATLKAQISADKESAEGDVGSLQTKLTSSDEAMKKAMEESAAKDATITDLHTRMLELQQTRVQLENEVDEMRDQKEKMLVENAQLKEVATQPTKYQHAVEEIKQLKRDNQELGNDLERAQAELQLFKENSIALKEQLDKATDQATLDAITDKMSKYKNERDDARAQVQGLQEQLHTKGSVGGASGDVVSKMSHYREEQNEAIIQVQVKQVEITKLNAIIAQMTSSQAALPSAGIFNRQISEEQPSSLPSGHDDIFGSESDLHSSTSDVPSAQSSLQSSGKHSGNIKATTSHLTSPASKITPSKISPQSVKKLPTSSGTPGALKQPSRRTSKSVIKEVVTASGNQTVSCKPVSSFVEINEGQRVVVSRANSSEYGTVRAVNVSIEGKKFFGVEMDLPSMYVCNVYQDVFINFCFYTGGSTDGQVKGVHHFLWLVSYGVYH